MMRAFASVIAAFLFALGLGLETSAVAQVKAEDAAASFVGRWTGVKDWNGAEDTPYDGGAWWELHSDGTFVDNSGETGRWRSSGIELMFRYDGGGLTEFNGRWIAGTVLGTMHNSDSSYIGIFAMWPAE